MTCQLKGNNERPVSMSAAEGDLGNAEILNRVAPLQQTSAPTDLVPAATVKKRASAPTQVGFEKSRDPSLDVTWTIDTLLDVSKRPMAGKDVERFQARHGLSISDTIYALCIQNSAKFNQICRLPALPFTLELLIRLYDESPSHTPWAQVTPQASFEALYGNVARDFVGSDLAKDVRLALYRRFSGALGRSIYTAYRWVQGYGNAKSQVVKIFGKLMKTKDSRETLERLARLMYRTRGLDLDQMYPMPSLESPPLRRRRGPRAGSKKLVEKVIRLNEQSAARDPADLKPELPVKKVRIKKAVGAPPVAKPDALDPPKPKSYQMVYL